jgi:hypothetical protein
LGERIASSVSHSSKAENWTVRLLVDWLLAGMYKYSPEFIQALGVRFTPIIGADV